MAFILGTLFGSLFNTFIVFLLLNFLLKKRLSLNVRALLTFLFVMIIDFFIGEFEAIGIIGSSIFNGISVVVAYFYFLSKMKKERSKLEKLKF